MNEQAINEQYDQIIYLLDHRRMTEALAAMDTFTGPLGDWEIRSSLEELRTSYHYLLKYMMEGTADPSRARMYHKMVASLYILADRSHLLLRIQVSTEYYFDRLRLFRHIPAKPISVFQMEMESFAEEVALKNLVGDPHREDAESLVLRKNFEHANAELFYRVWVSGRWTEEELQEARTLLDSVLVPVQALSLFASAVTLSLTEYFDPRKFMWLLDASRHASVLVSQRAMVGILISCCLYDKRLALYPEIVARLALLNEDPAFAANLLTVQIQFLRSRETEKIDKKMREEIIPEMVKNMNRMNKIDLEDSDEENPSDDRNPDWEDWAGTSGLQDKLKEMSELQMEGADVYMSTFSQLKRYPFFTEMANWFYPFDKQHSAVAEVFGRETEQQLPLLDNLLQSAFFCNSDKYSFCFTIMQVPQAQRSMMVRQLEEQNDSMKDEETRSDIWAFAQRPENVSNQYIQDLYRFYKVFPRRHEFRSPFAPGVDIYRSEVLKEITHQPGFMRTQADFLFRKGYFTEACILYQDLVKANGADAELYQKIGFCLQKSKNYPAAVTAYLNADLQLPDNEWTNHHLAMCYRLTEQYDKALEYYRKVEAVRPDNLKVVTQTGYCLAKLKRYDEALAYFFKVEYLNQGSAKIWRAIGWCSFLAGKQEQAMKYFDRITGTKEARAQDYLNAGHVAWVSGDVAKASAMYAACRGMLSDDEQFLVMFDEDRDLLAGKGVAVEDFPLMCDLAFYRRSEQTG